MECIFKNPFITSFRLETHCLFKVDETMFSPISVLAKTEPSGFSSAEYISHYFYTVCRETHMTPFTFNHVSFQSHEQASRTADLERDCCAQRCKKNETEVHQGQASLEYKQTHEK